MIVEPVYTPHVHRDLWLRPGSSDSIVWGEVFTGKYHVPPETMLTPATVLDLGSNIGLTLADYAYRWPEARIVGVELDPQNRALALRNAPGIEVIHAAVAGMAGRRRYSGTKPFAFKLDREGDSAVEARALEEIILSTFVYPVDFVKMDVEWTEWELLDVASRWSPLVRNLLVELHSRDAPEVAIAQAIAKLENAGFQAWKHDAHPVAVWAIR